MDSLTNASEAAAPFRRLLQGRRDRPLALLHSCGAGPAWLCTEPVGALTLPPADWARAFDQLEAFLRRHQRRRCVGWLGYDLRDAVEALPRTIPDDWPVPVLHVAAYAHVEEWPPLPVPRPDADPPPAQELRAHVGRRDYEARVDAVVAHIRRGDLFQANLTQPFSGRFAGDPRLLFWRLCAESPAPFAAYVEDGRGLSVLSASPEEFLRLQDGTARTRPIKGTRPRGADAARDRALLVELVQSSKDQAELAMIVDLMRNDLGKVAVPGSVRVGPFPEHASYAQVHHLLATVTADLRPDTGPVELLRATFPPGSVTGAPKLRCMEILEELELVRRGVYTGAIGWFGPGAALHLNVAIRTMVLQDGRVRFDTGGGITAESDPAAEWRETLHKAAGLERALGAVIEVPP